MTRQHPSQEAKKLRDALYTDCDGIHFPSLTEKIAVFEKIRKLSGGGNYKRKQHLNWCSRKEHDLRIKHAAFQATQHDVQPTGLVITEMCMSDEMQPGGMQTESQTPGHSYNVDGALQVGVELRAVPTDPAAFLPGSGWGIQAVGKVAAPDEKPNIVGASRDMLDQGSNFMGDMAHDDRAYGQMEEYYLQGEDREGYYEGEYVHHAAYLEGRTWLSANATTNGAIAEGDAEGSSVDVPQVLPSYAHDTYWPTTFAPAGPSYYHGFGTEASEPSAALAGTVSWEPWMLLGDNTTVGGIAAHTGFEYAPYDGEEGYAHAPQAGMADAETFASLG